MTTTSETGAATNDEDLAAARQKGRGREATSPVKMPAAAWKSIAKRVAGSIGPDRVMLIAGGVTYYMLLAMVPAMSAFVAIYGLFADRATVLEHTSLLSGIVPSGGMQILEEQLARIATEGTSTLSWTLLISLAIALWSASAGVKALFEAMNVAYNESEKRNFFVVNGLGLVFTLGAAVAAAVGLGTVVILPAVVGFLPIGSGLEWLIRILSYGVLLAVMVLGLSALYRWGPSRTQAQWRWITPGAVLAIVVIMAVSVIFSWYVSSFGNYNATYGSLGALIGFLTWMWISINVIVLGGELNSEVEHQTAIDSTIGADKPLGERGAYMADTVA